MWLYKGLPPEKPRKQTTDIPPRAFSRRALLTPLYTRRKRLSMAPVRKIYDYIILDLPPQMNKINTSAMIATEGMIIPIIPHELSLDGLKILIGHRNTVRKTHQVPVPILGILITLADRRGASVKAFIRSMREKYKDVIFETVIPINIDLADTVIVRTPIRSYAPASKGAQSYGTLAEEVIKAAQACRADPKAPIPVISAPRRASRRWWQTRCRR